MSYLEFATKWGNGCGHALCASARMVVLARGVVPCDVVFVGTAPGASENCVGLPFWGPAGNTFDAILAQAIPPGTVTYALCNLVGCMPMVDGRKVHEPADDQVLACAPRLVEFLELCQPQVIITVGQLAEAWLDPHQRHGIKLPPSLAKVPMFDIPHPSAILQVPTAQASSMKRRSIVVIANAITGLVSKETQNAKANHPPR